MPQRESGDLAPGADVPTEVGKGFFLVRHRRTSSSNSAFS
jgi:hypothetical protein